MTKRYAAIFGHNRPEELRQTFWDIVTQVDMVWIHDNASDPPLQDLLETEFGTHAIFVSDPEQPPNLARFWNITLDRIDAWDFDNVDDGDYKVAILNDDLEIPPNWFDAVEGAMDRTGAAAGSSSGFPGRLTQEILKKTPDADIVNRMYGPAFILRGGAHLRVDERLRWWWNDTDLDWRARAAGGMVMIPGPYVHNRHANESTTGVLAEQAGRDRATFAQIWGWNPW